MLAFKIGDVVVVDGESDETADPRLFGRIGTIIGTIDDHGATPESPFWRVCFGETTDGFWSEELSKMEMEKPKMPMLAIEERDRWREAALDTPIGFPNAPSAAEAMKVPGCCVKAIAPAQNAKPGERWPREFGRLVQYDEAQDAVLVRSHGDRQPLCIWAGTVSEYHQMWECD